MRGDVQPLAWRTWPVLLLSSAGLLLMLLIVLVGVVIMVPVLAGAAATAADACAAPALPTAGTVTATPKAGTPLAAPGLSAVCVNPDVNTIVYWAMQAAPHLYDCGPQHMDQCYDVQFPQPLVDWWVHTCPGCSQWQSGNLQCVMLAGAIFGVAGLPLYWGPNGAANGIDFWYNYGSYPGWTEISSTFEPGSLAPAPVSARRLPAPGDLIVWYDTFAPADGHLAIVVRVIPPHNGQPGSVTFVEANGPGALVSAPLNADLTVATWPGYAVAGYIRPVTALPVTAATPSG